MANKFILSLLGMVFCLNIVKAQSAITSFKIVRHKDFLTIHVFINNTSSDTLEVTDFEPLDKSWVYKFKKCENIDLAKFEDCTGYYVDDCCDWRKKLMPYKEINFDFKYWIDKKTGFVVRIFSINKKSGKKYIVNLPIDLKVKRINVEAKKIIDIKSATE